MSWHAYYRHAARGQRVMETLELIDWSEKFPNESSLQIAIRQSTYCLCGKQKEIGQPTCGGCKKPARIVSYWYRGSLNVNQLAGNGRQAELEQDIREFEQWAAQN